MIEIQPPKRLFGHYNSLPTIFLAGSIEMNTASRWQDRVKEDIKDLDVAVYNPRRDDWDNTIVQSITDARFQDQVNWELDAILNADIVVFYIDPVTKSPITLMELGMISAGVSLADLVRTPRQQVIVCCPEGFWRRGNIEVVCSRANIPLVNTYEDLIVHLRRKVELVTLLAR